MRYFMFAFISMFLFLTANIAQAAPNTATPTVIHRMIVFGDSLSDDGNDYATTHPLQNTLIKIPYIHNYFPTGIIPSANHEPYYLGHFSNGLTWAEDLANLFGIMDTTNSRSSRFDDFAYGGAFAHSTALTNAIFPVPLYWQVAAFALHQLQYPHKNQILALMLIGANDYLEAPTIGLDPKSIDSVVTPVINAQMHAIKSLYHLGVRHFLIAGLPRLDIIPLAKHNGPAFIAKEKALTLANNTQLQQAIQTLENDKHYAQIDITYLDLAAIHQTLDQNLANYSYNPSIARSACFPIYPEPQSASKYITLTATKAKVNSVKNPPAMLSMDHTVYYGNQCADHTTRPQAHIYFDQVHPTRTMHCMIALLSCQQLKQKAFLGYDYQNNQPGNSELNCHLGNTASLDLAIKLKAAHSYCQTHSFLVPAH
jgi:phospholipase/lecithinase/hemolysin